MKRPLWVLHPPVSAGHSPPGTLGPPGDLLDPPRAVGSAETPQDLLDPPQG